MLTIETIRAEMSDLYKDAFGVRPHHLTPAQWADEKYMRELWDLCISML